MTNKQHAIVVGVTQLIKPPAAMSTPSLAFKVMRHEPLTGKASDPIPVLHSATARQEELAR